MNHEPTVVRKREDRDFSYNRGGIRSVSFSLWVIYRTYADGTTEEIIDEVESAGVAFKSKAYSYTAAQIGKDGMRALYDLAVSGSGLNRFLNSRKRGSRGRRGVGAPRLKAPRV